MKPTQLRMTKDYIIYYQTWTWVVTTGTITAKQDYVVILFISGLLPFILLFFLNTRILLSLRNIRARMNSTYGDNNPAKGNITRQL